MKKTNKTKKTSKKVKANTSSIETKPLADIFPVGLSKEDLGRMIDTAIMMASQIRNTCTVDLVKPILLEQNRRCPCCGAPLDENQLAREQKQIQDTIDNSSLDKTRKPNYALDYYKDSLRQS